MLDNAPSSVLGWLIDHAVALLFVSVIATVVGDFIVRRARGRSIDFGGSWTSISAGIAYITAKGVVTKLIAGQFQHTELMRRRTLLDLVFVTPSAHRVHHGSNAEYLDKNFGSMLIIWDRIFGTYEAEVAPVTYGLTGTKRVRNTTDALVGGYPALFADIRGLGPRATVRHLAARP